MDWREILRAAIAWAYLGFVAAFTVSAIAITNEISR
jgi:hypothetical protein